MGHTAPSVVQLELKHNKQRSSYKVLIIILTISDDETFSKPYDR